MPLEQIREFLMVGAAEVGYEDFEAAIGSLGRDEIKEFRKSHPYHDRKLVKTTQHYECSGCDEERVWENYPSYVDRNKINGTNVDV